MKSKIQWVMMAVVLSALIALSGCTQKTETKPEGVPKIDSLTLEDTEKCWNEAILEDSACVDATGTEIWEASYKVISTDCAGVPLNQESHDEHEIVIDGCDATIKGKKAKGRICGDKVSWRGSFVSGPGVVSFKTIGIAGDINKGKNKVFWMWTSNDGEIVCSGVNIEETTKK